MIKFQLRPFWGPSIKQIQTNEELHVYNIYKYKVIEYIHKQFISKEYKMFSKLVTRSMYCSHNPYIKFNNLCREMRYSSKCMISTDIIKKHHQQVTKANPKLLRTYPKTFGQKAVVLNDPKMIQAIQIIQFGVKYKPGKKYLFLFMILIGAFTFLHQNILPQKIVDGYFAVSTQMNKGFKCGYFLAPFTYQKPFVMFLPLMAVIFQMSKFVRWEHMALLVLTNILTCGPLGKYLVDQRVKKYEVWDQQRIFYGQANLLSIGTGFWTMLGLKNGFTALKSRILLKAVPGAGIMRAGLPIAYILSVYIAYFAYTYVNQTSKNNQVAALCVLNSIIWGLLMRRFKPFVVK